MGVNSGQATETAPPSSVVLNELRVAEVLEITSGDISAAAELLGVAGTELAFFVSASEKLSSRWTPRPTPVTDADTITNDDPIVDPALSMSDEQLAKAMASENLKLRRGLNNLGLTRAEQELAMSLQAFQRTEFRSSMEIIGAGITRVTLKYQTELDAILVRLTDVRGKLSALPGLTGEARKFWADEERSLMQAYVAVGDQLRRIFEVSQRGAMTLALIRWRSNGGAAWQRPGGGKPGFRPKVMDVEPNAVQ